MKNKLFLLIGLTFLFSCNVRFEKRLYNKGYYLDITAKQNRKIAAKDEVVINNNLVISANPDDKIQLLNNKEIRSKQENIVHASMEEKNSLPSSEYKVSFDENSTITLCAKPDSHQHMLVPSHQKKGKVSFDALTGNQQANAQLFLLAAVMGLIVFGSVKVARKKSLQLSRWANRHKIATKLMIGALQMASIFMGVEIGKELFDFGYTFSNSVEYISGAITIAGMVGLVLTRRKDKIMSMRQFNLKKLSLVAIVMSSFILTVAIGNKIPDHRKQISLLGYVSEKIDNAAYKNKTVLKSDSGTEKNHVQNVKPNHLHSTKGTKAGRGLLALWIFLYIIMALALIIGICALFCAQVYGAAIPLLILGLAAMIIVPIYMAKWVANH